MRFVSWNIHAGVGRDGCCDLDRLASALAAFEADVIGLQEVEARPARSPVDQARVLAGRLGLHLVEGPLMFEGDAGYGNVLLSRWPVVAACARLLPGPGHEPRGFLDVRLRHPASGIWRVLVAHLDLWVRIRQRQLAALACLCRRHPAGPLVLLADLNEWCPTAPGLRRLDAALDFRLAPRTFPARLPLLPLDTVAGRGCRPVGAPDTGPAPRSASDHLPVVADLVAHERDVPPAGGRSVDRELSLSGGSAS